MFVDFTEMSGSYIYHLMTQTIIPRPIAWILTENTDATFNVAPFSYFTAVSSSPPLLMVSIGKKSDGTNKDTLVNIKRTGKAVIHIASMNELAMVNASSEELPANDSEVSRLHLKTEVLKGFSLPRLTSAPIAYACVLDEIKSLDTAPQQLVFLRVQSLYLNDDVVENHEGRLKINAHAVNPLARLGAGEYSGINNIVRKQRP